MVFPAPLDSPRPLVHGGYIPAGLLAVGCAHVDLAIDDQGPHQGRGAIGVARLPKRGEVQVVTLGDRTEVVFTHGGRTLSARYGSGARRGRRATVRGRGQDQVGSQYAALLE